MYIGTPRTLNCKVHSEGHQVPNLDAVTHKIGDKDGQICMSIYGKVWLCACEYIEIKQVNIELLGSACGRRGAWLIVGIPQKGDLEAGESLLLGGIRSLYSF